MDFLLLDEISASLVVLEASAALIGLMEKRIRAAIGRVWGAAVPAEVR